MALSVLAVYSHDHMAYWHLGLTATAQHHTAHGQPGKRSKFKTQSTVSKECAFILNHHKVKKL